MKNNLDKTNLEITQKLEQQEREKYTKRYNNLNYVDFSNPNADKISSASTTTIKQETLEEVAERLYPDCNNVIRQMAKETFINGAKWQQERSYSEEEVLNIIDKYNETFKVDLILREDFNQWFDQFKNN